MNLVITYNRNSAAIIEIDNKSDFQTWKFSMDLLSDHMAGIFHKNRKDLTSRDCFWNVTGRNIGSRKISVSCHIYALNAMEMIEKIRPYTSSWRAMITVYNDRFEAVFYHHNAPCGESYTIIPAVYEEFLI